MGCAVAVVEVRKARWAEPSGTVRAVRAGGQDPRKLLELCVSVGRTPGNCESRVCRTPGVVGTACAGGEAAVVPRWGDGAWRGCSVPLPR